MYCSRKEDPQTARNRTFAELGPQEPLVTSAPSPCWAKAGSRKKAKTEGLLGPVDFPTGFEKRGAITRRVAEEQRRLYNQAMRQPIPAAHKNVAVGFAVIPTMRQWLSRALDRP